MRVCMKMPTTKVVFLFVLKVCRAPTKTSTREFQQCIQKGIRKSLVVVHLVCFHLFCLSTRSFSSTSFFLQNRSPPKSIMQSIDRLEKVVEELWQL